MPMSACLRFLSLLALLMGAQVAWAVDPVSAVEPPLEADSASPETRRIDEAASGLSVFSLRLLQGVYAAQDHQLAWSKGQAEAMLALAEAAVAHGLSPADFHAESIRALLGTSTLGSDEQTQARWRADLLLSDALLRYLHHLQYGKHNPRHLDPDWTFVDAIDAAELQREMQQVLAAADLRVAVEALLPSPPFYEQLKAGYAHYLALSERWQAQGGWRPVPAGPNLTVGMRDPRVVAIRDQLAALEGGGTEPATDPNVYDAALSERVRAFQGRYGLAQDGVIGPRTLAALNQPLDDRIALIRANLERMRWLYHDLPGDYVLVDITAFQVELMRDDQPVWSTRAVVGTDENQTPMFRDEMDHLVFNPTWSVPKSIQKKMRGVPSDYRVIDRRTGRRVAASSPTDHRRYRLVQEPGPRNALGRVKFMFPNGHAIYLHDTPSRHLFAHGRRAYSHGCVRVQDPLELARALLANQNWDSSTIERVVSSGRTRYVNLDEHLPVLLYYLTARADEQGRVGFRDDLYGRDQRLLAALEGPPSATRIVFQEPLESGKHADRIPMPASESRPAPSDAEEGADQVVATGHPEPAAAADPRSEVATETGSGEDERAPAQPASASSSAPGSRAWWGLSMDPVAPSGVDPGERAGIDPQLAPSDPAGAVAGGESSPLAGWDTRDLDLDLRPVMMR